jgi:hypothetical protein
MNQSVSQSIERNKASHPVRGQSENLRTESRKSVCHFITRPSDRLHEMKTSSFLLRIPLYMFVRSASAFQNRGSCLFSRKSPSFIMRARSSTATDSIPVLGGIRDVVNNYDTFLLDMW